MRRFLICVLFVLAISGIARAETTRDCYYVADSALEGASAAAELAFPWRIGQTPTAEMRAAGQALHRTFDDSLSQMTLSFLVEPTPQGRRYVAPNGIAIQLRIGDCEIGLRDVQAYLRDLEALSTNGEVSAALASFRENARQVTPAEFNWVSQPTPIPTVPR